MIGGEWEISNGFLQGGLMYEIGSKYKALMYYTEHRYYGKSKPTKYIIYIVSLLFEIFRIPFKSILRKTNLETSAQRACNI